ncbi:MAG: Ig-like domain-containing protein [Bacteroidales bacterium]|jgi:hypothetical protein|nr:Ig-like domain-containing protein [Bacteroidales bacterium]
MRRTIILLIAAIVCSLQGLAGQKSIKITGKTMIFVGDTTKLLLDDTTDKKVIWSSSDPTIAIVDSIGIVKAINKGDVTITANAEKEQGVIILAVDYNPPKLIQSLKKLQESTESLHTQISSLKSNFLDMSSPVICIIGGIAVLALIGFIFCLFKISQHKKRLHDEVLNLLNNENDDRMNRFKKAIITDMIKNQNSNSTPTAYQPEGNHIKQIEKAVLDELKKEELKPVIPEQPKSPTPAAPQSQSLYADVIIDGKFNRVREQPNEDTTFELMLGKPNDMQAKVIIWEGAYRRVLANSSFLENCEKQILGNTNVTMIHNGEAQKENDGKWHIIKKPEVKIS